MDPHTTHALAILERCVRASTERKTRAALDIIRRALDPEGTSRPGPMYTRCEIVPATRAAEFDDDARADDEGHDPWQADDTLFSDDMLSAAIAAGTGKQLMLCPPAVPLPRQAEIVTEAIAAARAAGLALPPTIAIAWREGRANMSGCAVRDASSGACTIVFNVNVWPDTLQALAFHELQHLDDFCAGRALSRLDLEKRAIGFAAKMMRGWP